MKILQQCINSTAYHRQKPHWSYPDMVNINVFFDDWADQLTQTNLAHALRECLAYRHPACDRRNPILLQFGGMSLEVLGIDEVCTVLTGIEHQQDILSR